MPILFDLPTDLALAILMEWLVDTESLLSLDCASARSVRWAYLGLVRDPRFMISQSIKLQKEASDIRHWINARAVKIRSLDVHAPALKKVTRINYESLSTVNSLTMRSANCPQSCMESFFVLLRLLPSLTSLDMTKFRWQGDDYLAVLSTMHHLQLRTLFLDDYSEACEDIGLVVYSFGSTLEVLNLGTTRCLNAAILHLMGTKCKVMRKFSFYFRNITTHELVSALGEGKFPLLEAIEIGYNGAEDLAPISDDVVLALCASHPNLEAITAKSGSSITLSSVTIAFSHCPRFRELDTSDFHFSTSTTTTKNTHASAQPYYELTIEDSEIGTAANLRAAFGSVASVPFYKHKVRVFESIAADWKLADEDVVGIIDTFGKDLHTLQIELGDNVSHQTLARLLEQCTKLHIIYFDNCVVFTDELVMLLADQCPLIHALSLAGAVNITNLSMCYLLQRLGHGLENLYIEQCSHLTNSTLIAIAEYCTQLETLDISGTGITADAMVTHVIKRNRLLMLEGLIADSDTKVNLRDFVKGKNNGADARWGTLLECE